VQQRRRRVSQGGRAPRRWRAPQVSRAHALVDELRARVAARVPAELEARCAALQARGGLGPPPPGALADDPLPLPQPRLLAPAAGGDAADDADGGADALEQRWARCHDPLSCHPARSGIRTSRVRSSPVPDGWRPARLLLRAGAVRWAAVAAAADSPDQQRMLRQQPHRLAGSRRGMPRPGGLEALLELACPARSAAHDVSLIDAQARGRRARRPADARRRR